MVGEVGVEPTISCENQLLRLARMPIPPLARGQTLRVLGDLFNSRRIVEHHVSCWRMRIILIHGFNASPEMNFHPWLARSLKEKGFDVVTPTLNLASHQELKLPEILLEMRRQIGRLSGDDILLGHSLGGLLMLQYLESAEMDGPPRAAVLVASPWIVGNPALRQLFIVDLDADVLMWKAREFVVIHSKDDKLVPLDHGRKWAEVLKGRFVEVEGDGHFMNAEYPILLQTLEDIAAHPHEYAPGMSLGNDFET